jgi:DNA-binding CsgD family transcriptional regulator
MKRHPPSRSTNDYLGILEAIYRLSPDEGRWLEGIVEAAAPVVGSGLGAIIYTVHFQRHERHFMQTLRSSRLPEELLANWIGSSGGKRTGDRASAAIDARRRRAFFVPAPRATTIRRIARGSPDDPLVAGQLRVIGDALGIRGTTLDGRSGVLLAAPSRLPIRLTGRRQRLLDRIGSHLATAHRLRRKLAGNDLFSVASAVLSLRGRVLHVAGGDRRAETGGAAGQKRDDSVASFESLGAGLLTARSLGRGGDQEAAVEAWRALLAGRWSAIDHQDRDGKRFLLMIANPAGDPAPAALTGHERQILVRVAARHPLKLVGYELGLAASTVSEQLQSALRKLRLVDVSEAIRLFGARSVQSAGT